MVVVAMSMRNECANDHIRYCRHAVQSRLLARRDIGDTVVDRNDEWWRIYVTASAAIGREQRGSRDDINGGAIRVELVRVIKKWLPGRC